MSNPYKVLNFLDVTGSWDPSLALVMASALLITIPGYLLILKMQRPIHIESFDLPTTKQIDLTLIIGAICFGIGWGIAGYCPGPGLAALAFNWKEAFPFLIAVIAGGYISDLVMRAMNK